MNAVLHALAGALVVGWATSLIVFGLAAVPKKKPVRRVPVLDQARVIVWAYVAQNRAVR